MKKVISLIGLLLFISCGSIYAEQYQRIDGTVIYTLPVDNSNYLIISTVAGGGASAGTAITSITASSTTNKTTAYQGGTWSVTTTQDPYTQATSTLTADILNVVTKESTLLTVSTLTASSVGSLSSINSVVATISTMTAEINGKITACNTGAIAGTVIVSTITEGNINVLNQISGYATETTATAISTLTASNLDSLTSINTIVATISTMTANMNGKITACDTGAIVGSVSINGSSNTVKDYNYQVSASTYYVITVTASGSTALTFEVDSISAISRGGDNSFDINSIATIPVYTNIPYTTPVKMKRYVNPTINYTVSYGTMTIVVEGYNP